MTADGPSATPTAKGEPPCTCLPLPWDRDPHCRRHPALSSVGDGTAKPEEEELADDGLRASSSGRVYASGDMVDAGERWLFMACPDIRAMYDVEQLRGLAVGVWEAMERKR